MPACPRCCCHRVFRQLLEEFLQTKAKRSSHERLYGEVVDGMRSYFNQVSDRLA